MQVQTNPLSLKVIRALYSAQRDMSTAAERISTHLRINSAADDPGGLMVADRIKTEIQSVSAANQGVHTGLGATQVVDQALSAMSDVLGNMYALSSNPGTMSSLDYGQAMSDYLAEIDQITSGATYNGKSLMSADQSITLASGDHAPAPLSLKKTDMTWLGLVASDIQDLGQAGTGPGKSGTTIDTAINKVNSYQAQIGAQINVLNHHQDYLNGLSTQYSQSYGRIMNADLALEASNLASAQVRRDGATAMLAQANGINKDLVAYLLKSLN